MGEVIDENDLGRHIRYRHRIDSASWSSADNRWTIEATRTDTGEAVRFTANFLWMCQGYYRHAEGYTPDWEGMDRLPGPHRPSADLAGGPRLHGQAGRRDRLGRHGGDGDAGDGGRLRARHHAAALAHLFPHRPQRHRDRRRAARGCRWTRPGSTRSCAARSCYEQAGFTRRCFRSRRRCKEELLAAVRSHLGPDYDIEHALHAELPALAAAPRLRPRRRHVQGDRRGQGLGRHRRDRALHRDGHPAEVGQACSRPTSSSPPPAST